MPAPDPEWVPRGESQGSVLPTPLLKTETGKDPQGTRPTLLPGYVTKGTACNLPADQDKAWLFSHLSTRI